MKLFIILLSLALSWSAFAEQIICQGKSDRNAQLKFTLDLRNETAIGLVVKVGRKTIGPFTSEHLVSETIEESSGPSLVVLANDNDEMLAALSVSHDLASNYAIAYSSATGGHEVATLNCQYGSTH
jgi:hypothetical protein